MAALYSVPGGESSQLNVKVTKRHLKILSPVTRVWWCAQQRRGPVLVKESVGRRVVPWEEVQLDNESLFLYRGKAIFIHPHPPPSLTNQA